MQNHVMIQQCDTWPRQSSEVFQRRDPPEQAGSQNDLPRDDTFLHRARSFDSRDKAPPSNALRSTDIFRNPPPSMRLFHQPPSYRVPAMMSSLPPQQSPPFRYPVGRAGTSGLQSTQGSPVAVNYQQRLHQSRTENQNLRKMIGESKGRCVALGKVQERASARIFVACQLSNQHDPSSEPCASKWHEVLCHVWLRPPYMFSHKTTQS